MYRVSIIGPDNFVAKTIYLEEVPTTQQAENLLAGREGFYLDVCRQLQAAASDGDCWEEEDYYDCFDPIEGWESERQSEEDEEREDDERGYFPSNTPELYNANTWPWAL